MLEAVLTLSMMEIALLLFGAIILGITIHFFFASRRTIKAEREEMQTNGRVRDEWKIRYFNDMEAKDREVSRLNKELEGFRNATREEDDETHELIRELKASHAEIERLKNRPAPADNSAMVQELQSRVRQLEGELAITRSEQATMAVSGGSEGGKQDYIEQLRQAQISLIEHSSKINDLLGNIDVIKEKEEKEREILNEKEILESELELAREELTEKEKQIDSIRHKESVAKEMTSMLDNAYADFNMLQDKLRNMESQMGNSKLLSLEYEDLKEQHIRSTRDLDEARGKAQGLQLQNNQLTEELTHHQEQLKEVEFQRQRLQKRVAYLEEINQDLTTVNEANKKLEGQLRRIGELESLLHVVSEERDQLARR